jgi:hypothetical protein
MAQRNPRLLGANMHCFRSLFLSDIPFSGHLPSEPHNAAAVPHFA